MPRMIAFYLPQYHPIPENDKWWGKGFTEWTNVAKAKPMFDGHYQPHVPADLGFYDLRVPETRIAQAEMAKEYGIEAFCYYHYWFAGKRIIERPLMEVLKTGQPDFPFCLCWGNHSWTGIWHGCPGRKLIEQTYPGFKDHLNHFHTLMEAFQDSRYLTVDNKPVLLIYYPLNIPDVLKVTDLWREEARKCGLNGLYLVGMFRDITWVPQDYGFDASLLRDWLPPLDKWVSRRTPIRWLKNKYDKNTGKPTIYSYKEIVEAVMRDNVLMNGDFPCVIPNWDNTPRSGSNGLVLHGSTPELFRSSLRSAIDIVRDRPKDHRLVFLKSWNEWAEGNYLEPDLKFGRGYLDVIKEELSR